MSIGLKKIPSKIALTNQSQTHIESSGSVISIQSKTYPKKKEYMEF
jgi:hypothetical protein